MIISSTKDIHGVFIKEGDVVGYDLKNDHYTFTVVWEDNALRKKYKRWDKTLQKPILETQEYADQVRMKIIS